MIDLTTHNSEGQIHQTMTLLNEAEADLNGTWIAGHWSSDLYFVENGQATLRPIVTLPDEHSLNIDAEWVLSSVPSGSSIIIDGSGVGIADAAGATLSFDFPGTYRLEVRPPFPWRNAICEVLVS